MHANDETIHVLLVDDEASLLDELRDFLLLNGQTVSTAGNGAEALAALEREPGITVVLTDIRMPVLDGLTFASRIIHARGDGEAIEVVVMTGQGSVEMAAEAVRAGAFDFLRKPMLLQATLGVLRRGHAKAVRRRAEHARRVAELEHLQAAYAALQARLAGPDTALDLAVAAPPELANILSHELRTPLIPLLALPDLLGSQQSLPPGVFNTCLRDVREAGQRLTDVAEDLIEFLAPPDARMLAWRHVAPDSVLTRLLAHATARARESGVVLLIAGTAEGTVETDEARLVRALDRLLANALAATRAQGGRIELSARNVADDHVAFSVRDNGTGMSADDIAVARLPFRQLDMSHRRRIGGMGLGLPLAERMATRLGGRLEIASSPAAGTEAAIIVPRRRAAVDRRVSERLKH